MSMCSIYSAIKSFTYILYADGRNICRPVDIKTMPYPGFPTDMQAQMMMTLLS